MHTQVGSCPHCGAPLWCPTVWGGITPPPTMRSCGCITGLVGVVSATTNTGIRVVTPAFRAHA